MNGYETVVQAKREKRERVEAKETGRRLGTVAALREALKDAGAKVVESRPGTVERIDGEHINLGVAVGQDDKLRITWGHYGDRCQRPEPKAGFDFAKIAGDILGQLERRQLERAKKQRAREAAEAAEAEARRVNKILDGEFQLGARIVQHPAEAFAADRVNLRIFVRDCDEATARRVMAAVTKALEEEV